MKTSRMKNWIWKAEAMGFSSLKHALLARSIEDASDLGAALLGAIGPRLPAHRTALDNLAQAFPELSPKAVRDLAGRVWREIGRTMGEIPHLPGLSVFSRDSRFTLIGGELLESLKAERRAAIFISGHFGNWEAMAAVLCQSGLDCAITYRRVNNPLIDAEIMAIRRGYGVRTLTAKSPESIRDLYLALKDRRSVSILNDQKLNEGVKVPFFGRGAMTAPVAVRLAHKFGVPLVPSSTFRTAPGRFHITAHPPIALPGTLDSDGVYESLCAVNRFLEDRIRERPEQWFWVHRRWPRG